MTKGIARDCSAKLQGKLAEVLERELNLFGHVLDPMQMGEVMLESAVMLVRTTAATIAGYADSDGDVETLFRAVTASILELVQQGEPEGIARTVKALGERRS